MTLPLIKWNETIGLPKHPYWMNKEQPKKYHWKDKNWTGQFKIGMYNVRISIKRTFYEFYNMLPLKKSKRVDEIKKKNNNFTQKTGIIGIKKIMKKCSQQVNYILKMNHTKFRSKSTSVKSQKWSVCFKKNNEIRRKWFK